VARTGLVKERTRLRNRGQVQTIPVLKRQTKARLALLERIRPVSARFQVFSACQFQGMSSSMRLIL